MRPVFRDPQLEARFTERGYVVIDALDAEDVAELTELHAAMARNLGDGFRVSLHMPPGETKQATHEVVRAVYERRIAGAMHDHVMLLGGFAVKTETGDSRVPWHLDWSMVDETADRSLTVWMPLCDTTGSNGALAVVPGSHRLRFTRRGSQTPSALSVSPEVVAEHATLVPMRAGQALLWESRLIHGSASNTSGRPRVAASASLVGAGAQPLHYVGGMDEDGSLREVEVDREFFSDYVLDPKLGRSLDLPSLVSGRSWRSVQATPPITADHLRGLSRSQAHPLRKVRRFGAKLARAGRG